MFDISKIRAEEKPTWDRLLKLIPYVSHPYRVDPKQSHRNVIYWVRQLRIMGFSPLSPILHNHTYYEENLLQSQYSYQCLNFDCDSGLISYSNEYPIIEYCNLCGQKYKIILKHPNCEKINEYVQDEDFLQWDLDMISRLKSGLFMIISKSAYTYNKKGKFEWTSVGCGEEYQTAVICGMPIFELESFLNYKLVLL